ncbi:SurA N-terminal domain-containing protein [Luteolibacter sp. Populi]|uniref:peptidylprolyl isomerase n=1 Tax=Luteolibacter sp. Populi TaxID=3230487 RepID=UPI00346798E5
MIEHLRKYTGLIIFVIALLFVGLAFFGDNMGSSQASTNNPVVLTVDGTSYTATNYRKLAEAPLSLAQNQQNFQMAMQLGLFTFAGELGAFGAEGEQGLRRFFINRLNLRAAGKEFGIHPSPDEIKARVMKAFADQNGAFDQARYNDFVELLHRFGMQEKTDWIDLVSDILTAEKMKEIVGSGLAGNRQLAVESTANSDQQVTIQVARTVLPTFMEQVKPTDEELKTAWETTKEKYMVDRKIKVTYLIAKPKYPEKKTEPPKLPTALSEDAKKAEEKAEAERKAKEEAEYAAQKRDADDELLTALDSMWLSTQNSNGKDFEKLGADNGWELVSTELFQRVAVPPALAVSTIQSTPTPLGDYLFRLSATSDPLTSFTEAPLPLKDGAYIIARLDGSEEARPKTFEEAKEEVRTDYIKEKATAALKKDAEDKATKIREGLKAGKPFADLAKELALEPKSHGPFKRTDKLEGEADTTTLFETAATVDPGTLADPVIKPDGALFVFVEKRELVKDPARDERVNQGVERQTDEMQRYAFQSWLSERLDATRIEDPFAKTKP